ncbi:MAG: hypothetical protein ACYS5V_12650 [Planctomycetota bacterium]|jgi:hypothetical protein
MTIQFPDSPSQGDTFEASNGVLYTYDSGGWTANNPSGLNDLYVEVAGDTMTGDLTTVNLTANEITAQNVTATTVTATDKMYGTTFVRTDAVAPSGVAWAKGIANGSTGTGIRLLNCTSSRNSRGIYRITFDTPITKEYAVIAMAIDDQYMITAVTQREESGFSIVVRDISPLFQGTTGTPSTSDCNVSWAVFA